MSESKLEPVARKPFGSVTTTLPSPCNRCAAWLYTSCVALQRHTGRRPRVHAAQQRDRVGALIHHRLWCGCRYLRSVRVQERHARVLKDGTRGALWALALVRACRQIVVYAVVDLLNEVHRTSRGALPVIWSTSGVRRRGAATGVPWGVGFALGACGLQPATTRIPSASAPAARTILRLARKAGPRRAPGPRWASITQRSQRSRYRSALARRLRPVPP